MSSAACRVCAFSPTVDSITIPLSPSPNRLRTNYVPAQSEAYQIRSALSQVDSDLSKLDSALAQLKVIQDRLLLKRKSLQTFSKEHIGLLSSILRIPPEILAAVFLSFAPTDQSQDVSGLYFIDNLALPWLTQLEYGEYRDVRSS